MQDYVLHLHTKITNSILLEPKNTPWTKISFQVKQPVADLYKVLTLC